MVEEIVLAINQNDLDGAECGAPPILPHVHLKISIG
jgi:hypothetical protein